MKENGLTKGNNAGPDGPSDRVRLLDPPDPLDRCWPC
jgi:hypothetical protein